tara:strand:- start:4015 stop:5142 length:1128 start_codon:yes stop_codon:yes gene_type:complete
MAVTDDNIKDWKTDFAIGGDTNTPKDTDTISQSLGEEIRNFKKVVREEENNKGWITPNFPTVKSYVNFLGSQVITFGDVDLTSLIYPGQVVRTKLTSFGTEKTYSHVISAAYNGIDTVCIMTRMFYFCENNWAGTGPHLRRWSIAGGDNNWLVDTPLASNKIEQYDLVLMRPRQGLFEDRFLVRKVKEVKDGGPGTTWIILYDADVDMGSPANYFDRYEQYPHWASASDATTLEVSSASGDRRFSNIPFAMQGAQIQLGGSSVGGAAHLNFEFSQSTADPRRTKAFYHGLGQDTSNEANLHAVALTSVNGSDYAGDNSVGSSIALAKEDYDSNYVAYPYPESGSQLAIIQQSTSEPLRTYDVIVTRNNIAHKNRP